MSVKCSTVLLLLLALLTVYLTPTACARAAGNFHVQLLRPSTVSIRIATDQSCGFLTGERSLLQAASGTATVNTGPTSGLPDLTAVEAVAALCARNFTAVQYVTALNERYVSGGYSCNNPWITYNVTMVCITAADITAIPAF